MSNGRRQPSRGGTSRMTRECQVRICERLGVKFPGPTRQLRRRPHLIRQPMVRKRTSPAAVRWFGRETCLALFTSSVAIQFGLTVLARAGFQ